MGANQEEEKSEADAGDSDEAEEQSEADNEENQFKEDLNIVSKKHANYISLEEREREDMDFPDEVDTPFKDARVRF